MKLFTEIEDVWWRTTGWCSIEKAMTLASITLAVRPKTAIEIGVWHGRSFFPVAQTLRFLNQGVAIAIDPWKAQESIDGQINPADQEWWNRQEIHDSAFLSFGSSVDKLQLSRFVQVHRKSSNEVSPVECQLLSIDGNHGEQVIKDVVRFCPHVTQGGFVVMDDLEWTGGSVKESVSILMDFGFIELYRVVNDKEQWAVFQRK